MKKSLFWRRVATLTIYPIVFALICAIVIPVSLAALAGRIVLRLMFAFGLTFVMFFGIGVTLWCERENLSKALDQVLNEFKKAVVE
jgi:uncharacterized iron-regulated membrane protein